MPALAGVVLLWKIGPVSEYLKSHGPAGLAIYALAFAVLAGLALLPTYAQAILGGWAFGVAFGLPAALAGFVGGSIIGYEVARRASKDHVEKLIDEKPKWRAVRDAMVGHGPASFWRALGTVILLRLPPNSPFALMNLLLASVKVDRAPYIIGTLIGMAPRTALAVVLGAGIQGALTKDVYNSAIPTWMKAAGIFVSLAVVAVIGHIANKAVQKMGAAQQP